MGDAGAQLVKPRIDKREYRSAILSNDLRVLLVSDPETDKAAAAMDVSVGSFCDPEELPGLAHFLEHMLFFSSEKYPQEDEYSKFLIEHGGHSNAFTGSEDTNYFFDVNAEHLEAALDRFAQFFICPLMSQDATSREIKAVDSENSKNLTGDRWRIDQLTRHLSSKDHPYHKYGTGNLDTLDVWPKAKGIDTRAELLNFYKAHYSANLMRLVVYGRESLDDLEAMVNSKFSAVPNTSKQRPYFPGTPCSSEHLQIMVKAVSIKERHTLELMWPIISELKNYKAAPCRYIGHILGHESDGSLFSLLKSLGWANSLSAGEMERSLDFSFFAVCIELTDAGQEHVDDIISMTFQYIRLLRDEGISERIFEEIRTICEMKFHYQDKSSPFGYVSRLAGNMQYYPVEDWLVGSNVPDCFDPKAIKEEVDLLSPERVRVFWSSKKFEGETNETEPWYGTAYCVERFPEDVIKQWSYSPLDAKLHLPAANPFIPTDFSLRNPDANLQMPRVVRGSNMSSLWFKPDHAFKTPKASITVNVNCPETNYSPEAAALSTIFTKLLVDQLNEYAYYAEVAGLEYNISGTSAGFRFSVAGYSHKLPNLLEMIVDKLVKFKFEEDRFLIIREKLHRDYINFKFQQPYQQAIQYSSTILDHKKWHFNDYVEILPSLEASDLQSFLPRILSRVYLECFVAGNMSSKEAQCLGEKIEKMFSEGTVVKTKPPLASQMVENRVLRMESGSEFYYPVASLNASDENSALQVYFQIGQDSTQLNVLLELFVLSSKQQVFHQLRTVEQLGYIVALLQRNDFGVQGAQIIIQSPGKDPAAIEARVEEFLRTLETYLKGLTDDEFKRNVAALIENKLEKHKNLWEERNFYWKEIDNGTFKFDRQQVEVEALKSITKNHLVQFFEEHIKAGSQQRKKLSIQVFGKLHSAELEASSAKSSSKEHRIDDIFSFRRSQGLYMSLKNSTTV